MEAKAPARTGRAAVEVTVRVTTAAEAKAAVELVLSGVGGLTHASLPWARPALVVVAVVMKSTTATVTAMIPTIRAAIGVTGVMFYVWSAAAALAMRAVAEPAVATRTTAAATKLGARRMAMMVMVVVLHKRQSGSRQTRCTHF